MKQVNLLNDYNGKWIELSKLIRSWNLIQVNSKNEYDMLAKKILVKLYEEQTELKIKQLIESELCITYGLYKTEFNSNQLTKEVLTWWNG